jgi:hypothetical protein
LAGNPKLRRLDRIPEVYVDFGARERRAALWHLQEMVVTGSRVKRSKFAASAPVEVRDAQQIVNQDMLNPDPSVIRDSNGSIVVSTSSRST